MTLPFPVILYDLLDENHVSASQSSHNIKEIVSWDDEGLTFSIHDLKKFRSIILPTYFGSNFGCDAFLSHLELYGFEENDVLCFEHVQFKRGNRDLVLAMALYSVGLGKNVETGNNCLEETATNTVSSLTLTPVVESPPPGPHTLSIRSWHRQPQIQQIFNRQQVITQSQQLQQSTRIVSPSDLLRSITPTTMSTAIPTSHKLPHQSGSAAISSSCISDLEVVEASLTSDAETLHSTDIDEESNMRVVSRRRGRRPNSSSFIERPVKNTDITKKTTPTTRTVDAPSSASSSSSSARSTSHGKKQETLDDNESCHDDGTIDLRNVTNKRSSVARRSSEKRLYLDLTVSDPVGTDRTPTRAANQAAKALNSLNVAVTGRFHGKLNLAEQTSSKLYEIHQKSFSSRRKPLMNVCDSVPGGLQVSRVRKQRKSLDTEQHEIASVTDTVKQTPSKRRRSSLVDGSSFGGGDDAEPVCVQFGSDFQAKIPAMQQLNKATYQSPSRAHLQEATGATAAWNSSNHVSDQEVNDFIKQIVNIHASPQLIPGAFVVVTTEFSTGNVEGRSRLCCILEVIEGKELSPDEQVVLQNCLIYNSSEKCHTVTMGIIEGNHQTNSNGSKGSVNQMDCNATMNITDDTFLRIFDGWKEHIVALSRSIVALPLVFGEDQILEALKSNDYNIIKTIETFTPQWDLMYYILMDPMVRWSYQEVREFCIGFQEVHLNYIHQTRLSCRPHAEVVAFFNYFHGHFQAGQRGLNRVAALFRLSEQARKGNVKSILGVTEARTPSKAAQSEQEEDEQEEQEEEEEAESEDQEQEQEMTKHAAFKETFHEVNGMHEKEKRVEIASQIVESLNTLQYPLATDLEQSKGTNLTTEGDGIAPIDISPLSVIDNTTSDWYFQEIDLQDTSAYRSVTEDFGKTVVTQEMIAKEWSVDGDADRGEHSRGTTSKANTFQNTKEVDDEVIQTHLEDIILVTQDNQNSKYDDSTSRSSTFDGRENGDSLDESKTMSVISNQTSYEASSEAIQQTTVDHASDRIVLNDDIRSWISAFPGLIPWADIEMSEMGEMA